jgi:hypothetical protein
LSARKTPEHWAELKMLRFSNYSLWNQTPFPFVIPSEAEGSAVPRTRPGTAEHYTQTKLSSRLPRRAVGPERTRISCHAASDKAAYAPFFKERRMMFANATNF